MDTVRIILHGYGYEVARGIISKEQHKKIKNSKYLDNVWIKGLYKYLGEKWERIEEELWDYGITNGDIRIYVNDEEVLDLPISVIDTVSDVDTKEHHHPITEDVVMTTVQCQYGVIADIMFMLDGEFEIQKLKFVEKDIHNQSNEVIINSLISEIWYDDYRLPLNGSSTELRTSNVYFDK